MAEPIIQLVDITKKYGDFTAVDHLNLTVNRGEIFGLLGPNGAGKSTSILMMLGLTEPTSGEVRVCGINSTTHPIEVKTRVGYLPEDVGFYDDRTGLENLVYTALLNGANRSEATQLATELMSRVGLADQMSKKTGKYSKGMRQRLGLADVLIKNPEVIILDEPTSGIDPKGVQKLLDLIVELRNEHQISVLFSSHNLHQVQQVCDRVGIFVEGKLIAEGNIQSLSQQLFTHGMYLIELGLDEKSLPKNTNPDALWLKQILEPVEGVQKVTRANGLFQIECAGDVSSAVSKRIIERGLGLNFLNRKEYGLDAIYNRYFEGGV
ncbi:ABC-2 type transport system ATP-binding protein [Mariniphaga anaerophila]|uniref:ABC-2 type transport system ATP-binding protein n=1 Tax=Mariniphaga anaerophila TaxID=1484053 RepID=A0A1M4SZ44_9BACT|nr:ABC transporter ATP-binding protein [Mariniphaga anaerophila]SHE37424.1 ABC-2 type transport system ATP-binding protein [Mariniphaga anaerophila]